jgi:hypothetical protein
MSYDYDDAPRHPLHGGKLTASQADEEIRAMAARIVELEAALLDMIGFVQEHHQMNDGSFSNEHAKEVIAAAIRARGSK